MRREVEWGGKGGRHVVERDQKSYLISIHQSSPLSLIVPWCPHHLQAQLRAYHNHHYHHHQTHFQLTKLIIVVVNKLAIYTCNSILQLPKIHDSHCHSFFFKKSIAFLAILFLLLIISAGIVARSYILRRRYQRRLEDAMGPGLLLAPRAQGSKIKSFSTMPKMFNTWLAEGGDKWNDMMVSFMHLLVSLILMIQFKLIDPFSSHH